jgi:YD repeat-containing protein
MMAYMAAGVTRVRWVAMGKSCPYCRKLNGKVVGINSPFLQKGIAFEADGVDEQRGKKPPLVPSHDVKHPPAHQGCDCHLVAENRQESFGPKGDIIKANEVRKGRAPTPRIHSPDFVVDHMADGKRVNKRVFYDPQGRLIRQIDTDNHGRPKSHPFGTAGEHAHEYQWRDDEIVGRKTRELTEDERLKNREILPRKE